MTYKVSKLLYKIIFQYNKYFHFSLPKNKLQIRFIIKDDGSLIKDIFEPSLAVSCTDLQMFNINIS